MQPGAAAVLSDDAVGDVEPVVSRRAAHPQAAGSSYGSMPVTLMGILGSSQSYSSRHLIKL
ncbi:hypothetical protein [Streptomyces sp. SP18BB07]|uniref:hypothetical protein n=1 Tax=Streptomyces sp. SP18BB07 TaxID=3002522 RepID=UPI002E769208|nr:hypothetical protein [Streptomyces sp. SP18BB07]MEE1763574.1 hypothetical protein [Streptomyces sp. SP18BB07]